MSKAKANEEERQKQHQAFLLDADDFILTKDPALIKLMQEKKQAQQYENKKSKVDSFDKKANEQKEIKESKMIKIGQNAIKNLLQTQQKGDDTNEKKLDDQHKQRTIQMKQNQVDQDNSNLAQQQKNKELVQKLKLQKRKDDQQKFLSDKQEGSRLRNQMKILLDTQKENEKLQSQETKQDLIRQLDKKLADKKETQRLQAIRIQDEQEARRKLQELTKFELERATKLEQIQKENRLIQKEKVKASLLKADKHDENSQGIQIKRNNKADELKEKHKQKSQIIEEKKQQQYSKVVKKLLNKREIHKQQENDTNQQIKFDQKQYKKQIIKEIEQDGLIPIQSKKINHKKLIQDKILFENRSHHEFLSKMGSEQKIQSWKNQQIYLELFQEAKIQQNEKVILNKRNRSLSVQDNLNKLKKQQEIKNLGIFKRYSRPPVKQSPEHGSDLKFMKHELYYSNALAHSKSMQEFRCQNMMKDSQLRAEYSNSFIKLRNERYNEVMLQIQSKNIIKNL